MRGRAYGLPPARPAPTACFGHLLVLSRVPQTDVRFLQEKSLDVRRDESALTTTLSITTSDVSEFSDFPFNFSALVAAVHEPMAIELRQHLCIGETVNGSASLLGN